MTYTENNIYWIITAQGREYHYPKALYSLPDAKKHLQKYLDEVGGKAPTGYNDEVGLLTPKTEFPPLEPKRVKITNEENRMF